MGKYNYMNLNQKMIRIRRKVPKLIRKRYSEDVTYDFVKQAGKLADEHTMKGRHRWTNRAIPSF